MARKAVDLTGQRFGMLQVLERTMKRTSPNGKRVTVYKCLCDCGRTTYVQHSKLMLEMTKSCGCLAGRPGVKTQKKKQPVKPGKKRKTPNAQWDAVVMPAHDLHPVGIQNFIEAFVRSCIKDILNSPPESVQRKQTEELLQTAYFERITDIDGTQLLARLQEEYDKREAQKKKRRNKA